MREPAFCVQILCDKTPLEETLHLWQTKSGHHQSPTWFSSWVLLGLLTGVWVRMTHQSSPQREWQLTKLGSWSSLFSLSAAQQVRGAPSRGLCWSRPSCKSSAGFASPGSEYGRNLCSLAYQREAQWCWWVLGTYWTCFELVTSLHKELPCRVECLCLRGDYYSANTHHTLFMLCVMGMTRSWHRRVLILLHNEGKKNITYVLWNKKMLS